MQLPHWFNTALSPHLSNSERDTLLNQLSSQDIRPEWLRDDNPPQWLFQFLSDFQTSPEFISRQWLKQLWIEEGFLSEPDPLWAISMSNILESGIAHQFILHLNVTDYVFDARYGTHRLSRYLTKRYPPQSRQFVFYNRSQGVGSAEQRFNENLQNEEQETSRWAAFIELVQRFNLERRNGMRFMEDPDTALQGLELLLRQETYKDMLPNAVIVFEFAEKVAPAIDIAQQDPTVLRQIETLQRWAFDTNISRNGHLIIMLTRNLLEINSDLRAANSQVETIEVPIPDRHNRLKYIAFLYYDYLSRYQQIIEFDPEQFSSENIQQLQQFADRTAGLNRIAIQDIVMRSFQSGIPINNQLIQERKQAVLRSESHNLLEVVEPEHGLEAVGGLEDIKKFLREDVITPLLSGDEQMKRTAPTGILFLGPPGTGKTIVAEALAKESGLNLVKLGNFREQWVGQSERNLSLALRIIRSMTPVIVFIDELDQSEGSRGEGNLDSGVSKRIFSQLLQFMGDTTLRGQVVWIGASNRPDLIDAAMRRPGRFDDKIPFLSPDAAQREDIFRSILRYKLDTPVAVIDQLALTDFARDEWTENYTGAEIEVILNRAQRLALHQNRTINNADLKKALEDFTASRDLNMNRYMTLLALREINNRQFIPPQYTPYFTEEGSEELANEILNLRERIKGY